MEKVNIECPYCYTNETASIEIIGQTVKCHKCNMPFTSRVSQVGKSNIPVENVHKTHEATANTSFVTKVCPFCAEDILEKAIICTYCKSSLPKIIPIATPTEPIQMTFHRTNTLSQQKKLIWKNPWLIILTMIGVVIIVSINIKINKESPLSDNIKNINNNNNIIGQEKTNPIDGAVMVWVPAGTFTIGSLDEKGYYNYDGPAHQVTFTKGFWIYKYEVTVSQYTAFCNATPNNNLPQYMKGHSWSDKENWWDPALKQYPIVNITCKDAESYAEWAGTNVPTEAQWEYAARGPYNNNYPWGGTETSNDPYNGWDQSKCANGSNSNNMNISTWPVGSFTEDKSWCGAMDLAGNASEWCIGYNYSSTPETDPIGAYPVLRGGNWLYIPGNLPSSFRSSNRSFKENLHWTQGFRCVANSL